MTQEEALALTKQLAKQLYSDRAALDKLDDYYRGKHALAFASKRFKEAFGGLFAAFADNWVPLVVDAVRQRLHVTGFRFADVQGDAAAWAIWQANYLDADSDILHTDAMVYGRSYVSVGGNDDSDGPPLITVESPLNVIVKTSGDNRRRRLSALRVFVDDWGTKSATLYTPEEVWRWKQVGSSLVAGGSWEPRSDVEDNPLGLVPIVPFLNRPRLDPWGYSEIANVLPLQDAVNKLVADMLVASEFAAMPQRWATGLEIERDPVTNEPRDPFPPLARLWQNEAADGSFGQFTAGDLSNYVRAIEMLIQHVASQTATPPHYFYLKGEFPSGESIKSAEAGLVAKANDKTRAFGESWEEVMRLGFRVLGDPRAGDMMAETIWADREIRTESQHVDAVLKKQSLGVPDEQLWEDLGYSPTQIQRFTQLREAQDRRNAEQGAIALGLGQPTGPALNGAQAGAQGQPGASDDEQGRYLP